MDRVTLPYDGHVQPRFAGHAVRSHGKPGKGLYDKTFLGFVAPLVTMMPSNPVETSTLIKLYETLATAGDRIGLTKQAVQERLKKIGYKARSSRRSKTFDRQIMHLALAVVPLDFVRYLTD